MHYSAGQPYCSAKFLSLRTGDEVYNIPYTEPITDIRANDRYDDFDDHVQCYCNVLLYVLTSHIVVYKILHAVIFMKLVNIFG